MRTGALRRRLGILLGSQRLAVVATIGEGAPYTNLVAFCTTPDLCKIVFATMRSTSKYRNLLANPSVSVLVDDRGNSPSDIVDAVTVSATGRAGEAGRDRALLQRLFLKKHPYLADFVRSPDCALICVRPERYVFVSRFQEVSVLEISPRRRSIKKKDG
jgi:nitroimidazol reductase NimA-like FMN-containing flavoprotein (pyridoxamine 5'-phosphate oxidase superfamily)